MKLSGDFRRDRMAVLLRNQRGRCIWCNCHITDLVPPEHPAKATIEHIKPRSQGGSDGLSNLAAACGPCNRSRGNQRAAQDAPITARKALAERFAAILKPQVKA